MPAVLEFDAQDVVVAVLQQRGEDLRPRNDAASHDTGPDGPLGGVDPGRFRGAECCVGIREDQVLYMHVTNEITLNSKGLFERFVVREGQVRLIVENTDGGVCYFPDEGGGVCRGLGHSAEVVFHAEANTGLVGFGRECFQCLTQLPPSCRVFAVARVPGAGIHTDPVSAEQVRGLDGATELIDPLTPFHIVQ